MRDLKICRGGAQCESSDGLKSAEGTSLNVTGDSCIENSTLFDKFIWSPEFAERGHDPLFMEGLTGPQAEYARKEWLKQVR